MSEKKVDYFGEEVKVGDEIVFMMISYRDLMRGIIVKLNPKKVTIACRNKYGFDSTDTTSQFYGQIIRVPEDKRVLKIDADGNLIFNKKQS